jgi:hypothetical protein
LLGNDPALFEPVPDINGVYLMADAELFQIVIALIKIGEAALNDLSFFWLC